MSPQSGGPGTLVTLTGSKFGPGDQILTGSALAGSGINIGGILTGQPWNTAAYGGRVVTIDSSGGFVLTLEVPSWALEGTNVVRVATVGGSSANLTFAVSERTLDLNPSSGPLGIYVLVSAADMGGTQIDAGMMTFDDTAWNSGSIAITSEGDVHPTTLMVTQNLTNTTGPKVVSAEDNASVTAKGVFTVTQPTIATDSSSGYINDVITITGVGWVPESMVTVSFGTPAKQSVITIPRADGTFSAVITIPRNAAQTELIQAYDTNGNVASEKAFTLTQAVIAVDPASGAAPTTITISGSGFPPQHEVRVGIGGSVPSGMIPMVITDGQGTFTAEVFMPGFMSGPIAVEAQVVTPTTTVSRATFFVIEAAEATVADALAGIADQLTIVWGYIGGDWLFFDPMDPGSDLETLASGQGYWVKVSEAVNLIVGGVSYSLALGWNNIGWI
jgi:hypothetical protein